MEELMKYETRIVAFIDILGFKEIIKVSQSDNVKLGVIYSALNYLKKMEEPDDWNLSLIEIEEDAQRKGVANFDISTKINCTCFSDSIVVSVAIDENNINEITSTLIANLAYVGKMLMVNGVLLRGAITIGQIIHQTNGTVLGQGLIDAFELENRVAKYPRILLSNILIKELNYPLFSKRARYPYHQYLKRYSDGCVGFHQMQFFQVFESAVLNKTDFYDDLQKVKDVIIAGLDDSFEHPDIHDKYLWLKSQFNDLLILNGDKKAILNLNEYITGHNIHYNTTDKANYK